MKLQLTVTLITYTVTVTDGQVKILPEKAKGFPCSLQRVFNTVSMCWRKRVVHSEIHTSQTCVRNEGTVCFFRTSQVTFMFTLDPGTFAFGIDPWLCRVRAIFIRVTVACVAGLSQAKCVNSKLRNF